MVIDVSRTVEILKNALLQQLGDEVDVIFRYGSHLKGTTHKYSDLDISYVPANETTWHSITVLVDDVMIDFYPIHWSRLEQMADFENVSYTVLLQSEIVYQRSDAVAERFHHLAVRLRELQQPASRPVMVSKAQALFQKLSYPYYLLQQQAEQGHLLSCLQHSQTIVKGVAHCLAVCNQAVVDTRKLDQILALPKLPEGFAETVESIINSTDPLDLLAHCKALLHATRRLLLAEQQHMSGGAQSMVQVFGAAYPELKGDLQHLMLACERHDRFNINLVSLYHELMLHLSWALTGVDYSDFNTIEEYEQNLVDLGFPDLLAYLTTGDLDGLREQCERFDQHLQRFLTEHDVPLYAFATLDDLEAHLKQM